MKLFRFSLLQAYFSLIKNKKKAIRVINIGIFFTIFAATSAVITFFIEQSINEKEFLLIQEQYDAKGSSSMNSEFESMMTMFQTDDRYEFDQIENARFLSWTSLGSKFISEKDYFAPIIYTALRDIKELDKLSEILIEGMNWTELMLFVIEDSWGKDDVEETKEIFDKFEESLKNIKKIDINFYKSEIYNNSPKMLFDEINNQKNNYLDPDSSSEIFSHYNDVLEFEENTIDFLQRMHMILRSIEGANYANIEIYNNEIIELSNKEKKLIFLTFILQLIAFILVQIFEVSSMNIQRKDKL